MTIKNLFRYTLIGALPTALILSATLPLFFLNNQSIQNSQNTTVINSLASTQTDLIDFGNVTKTNWTWPDAKRTGAFTYELLGVGGSGGGQIAQFDANGFTVNSSFPVYSESMFPIFGAEMFMLEFQTYIANLIVSTQKYNTTNKIIENLSQLISHPMTFGSKENGKLNRPSVLPNYILSDKLPYLKFEIPSVDQNVRYTKSINDGHESLRVNTVLQGNQMLLNYDNWQIINPSITDANHQGILPEINEHMHSDYTHYQANIWLYNDYDLNGNKLQNYMFFTEINTNLPIMTIDESKLNKNVFVDLQDTNVSGLVKLANAEHMPSFAQPTITATKNNIKGEITFNYKPKTIFVNGVLQEYTGSGLTEIISGFRTPLKTSISSKMGYPSNIVVDRFINSVKKDGIVDPKELGRYLDLNFVPPDAIYTIADDFIIDLAQGTIDFKINASNGYLDDDSLSGVPTPDFNISLQLTPRVTKMSYTGFTDNTLVNEYYDKVFDENGLIELTEFTKYMIITTPVDDAQYYLVPGSWSSHTGDGTLSFKFYATKYYGLDGSEIFGSADMTDKHFSINLILNPVPSSVTVKPNHTLIHRVDKFMDYIQPAGTVDILRLEEFFTLENIPSHANYEILNPVIENYVDSVKSKITFDLRITAFNDINGIPQEYMESFSLTLGEQHEQTIIQAKPEGSYDNSFAVNKFFSSFIDASDIVTELNFLKQFVDIKSLPNNATLSVTNKFFDNNTGAVSFGLIASDAYDSDSNLITNFGVQISLSLTAKIPATVITSNTSIVSPERVDRFANQLTKLSGTIELENYLFPKYLNLDGNLPDNVIFDVSDIQTFENIGKINFTLLANEYYDDDGDIQINYRKDFSLDLEIKYLTTQIISNENIANADRIDIFKTQLQILTNDDLKTYLAPKYLTIVGDLPDNTTIRATEINTTEITGAINFKLVLSNVYDENSDLVSNKTFVINLMVGIKHPPTTIIKKTYDHSLRVDRVANNLNTLVEEQLKTYLNQFLEFTSIPVSTNITVQNVIPDETSGNLTFDVILSQYYNANSDLIPGPHKFAFDLVLEQKHPTTTIDLKLDYNQNIRIDQFIEATSNLEAQNLYDYLIQNYVTIVGIVDTNAIFASILEPNYDYGTLKLKLSVPSYYDIDSNLVNQTKSVTFDLAFLPKYSPTVINELSSDVYPQDLTPNLFKAYIEKNVISVNNDVYTLSTQNIKFLNKFLSFNFIPSEAIYTLTWNQDLTNDDTGQLSFNLGLSQYYSADGDLILTPFQKDLTLNLANKNTIPPATSLTINLDAPFIDSEDEFLKMIYHTENVINIDNLALFVDGLKTIPTTNEILKIEYKYTSKGFIIHIVEVSSYYNGVTAGVQNEVMTFKLETEVKNEVELLSQNGFEWWWVATAMAGVVLLATSYFLNRQYIDNKIFKYLALKQKKV